MVASILVSISYIAAQMLSDIASLQIVQFIGLSIDAGTFIYPITFTLRDLAHKTLGVRVVRVLIISAAAINLFMAGFFWLIAKMPPDEIAGSTNAWGNVLSPVWRITIASIIAEIISEFTDTEIYHLWVTKITTRFQWTRVLTSNLISIPIDTFIFAFLAFYGTMPTHSVMQIVWGNIIIKIFVTIISLPWIYFVKGK